MYGKSLHSGDEGLQVFMKKNPSWDDTFIELTQVLAKRSKDTSTKVGAVIVGRNREIRSTGYNGMPRGVNDDVAERYERPLKYKWFEHAERNAIYNAARVGIPVEKCTMYVALYPCTDCARAIIQAGISWVVVADFVVPERWWADACQSAIMFREGGVAVRKPNSQETGGFWVVKGPMKDKDDEPGVLIRSDSPLCSLE